LKIKFIGYATVVRVKDAEARIGKKTAHRTKVEADNKSSGHFAKAGGGGKGSVKADHEEQKRAFKSGRKLAYGNL
jgi:hypothetical protein